MVGLRVLGPRPSVREGRFAIEPNEDPSSLIGRDGEVHEPRRASKSAHTPPVLGRRTSTETIVATMLRRNVPHFNWNIRPMVSHSTRRAVAGVRLGVLPQRNSLNGWISRRPEWWEWQLGGPLSKLTRSNARLALRSSRREGAAVLEPRRARPVHTDAVRHALDPLERATECSGAGAEPIRRDPAAIPALASCRATPFFSFRGVPPARPACARTSASPPRPHRVG